MVHVDCHCHTTFSDGSSTVEENVSRACELGLTTLCITDHLTLPVELDPACEVSVDVRDLDAYTAAISEARTRHPQISVVEGFECDYYPGCAQNIVTWSRDASFRLGSVHMLDGCWIDDPCDLSYWQSHSVDDVWRRYFEVWCEAAASGLFDSMAHPDLVSILGRYPGEDRMLSLFDQAATCVADCQVCVEINTSGLLRPVGRLYPHPELLKRFAHVGADVTLGSDAHTASRIGADIDKAQRLAYECGFRSTAVPAPDGDRFYLDLDR